MHPICKNCNSEYPLLEFQMYFVLIKYGVHFLLVQDIWQKKIEMALLSWKIRENAAKCKSYFNFSLK